jgi:hypothetical protein
VRPLQELTTAAGSAAADRLPGHGQLGKYQKYADLSGTLTHLYARLDMVYAAQRRCVATLATQALTARRSAAAHRDITFMPTSSWPPQPVRDAGSLRFEYRHL